MNFEFNPIKVKIKNRKEILIRSMLEKDLPEVAEIHDDPVNNPFMLEDKMNIEREKRFLISSHPYSFSIIAELDGKVIGRVGFWQNFGQRRAHILGFFIYLDSKFHNLGVGSAMLNTVFDFAKKQGITKVQAECFEDNKVARAFYKSLGFSEEGVHKKGILRHGKYIDEIIIGKFL